MLQVHRHSVHRFFFYLLGLTLAGCGGGSVPNGVVGGTDSAVSHHDAPALDLAKPPDSKPHPSDRTRHDAAHPPEAKAGEAGVNDAKANENHGAEAKANEAGSPDTIHQDGTSQDAALDGQHQDATLDSHLQDRAGDDLQAIDARLIDGKPIDACPAGQSLCNGACVNTSSDLKNCGFCGNACPVPANSIPACISEVCTSSCVPGFASCGGTCNT